MYVHAQKQSCEHVTQGDGFEITGSEVMHKSCWSHVEVLGRYLIQSCICPPGVLLLFLSGVEKVKGLETEIKGKGTEFKV